MADIKIYGDVDDACRSQLQAICSYEPFSGSKVRIMPDAHSGVNSIVGFTATVGDAVIPNLVGGDIGCGVLAAKLKKPKKGMDFNKLDKVIRSEVPTGMGNIRKAAYASFDYEELACWEKLPNKHVIPLSLGSLGAGNHFIAIDKDSHGDFWLVVHTGSRNLGTKIAEHYQSIAASRIGIEISDDVPHSMAWLEGGDMESYLADMDVACKFSSDNRWAIVNTIAKACGFKVCDSIESIHNYIDTDKMMIRKGAIDASAGVPVVIPLNMAEGCAFGEGLGNSEWNFSAPHGAGRAMTRKEARESISMSDYRKSMESTWSSCVGSDTVDESPAAYKDASSVLDFSSETVRIDDIAREIYNFKAPSGS